MKLQLSATLTPGAFTALFAAALSAVLTVFVASGSGQDSEQQVAKGAETTRASDDAGLKYWPQWRGPLGTGVAPRANPPIEWDENQHVRWKTRLPGLGHSSPVVWGDLVFLTAAVPYGPQLEPVPETAPGAHDNVPVTQKHRFVALAIERKTGKIAWQKTLADVLPHEGGHYTGSPASASPVTDGKHCFFYFGSHGLFCLDLEGNVVWQKTLGKMQTKHAHGEGSSPALHQSTLVVNWDHEGQSFLIAFDGKSGNRLWKIDRDEVTSWSSPIIYEHNGTAQVIVAGTNRVRSYDLATGKTIWQCGGLSNNVVATPIAADGMVFVGSSYDTRMMMGIRLANARGDISSSDHVVWSRTQRTPYVPSPLLYGDALYFLRHYQGILTRLVAKSGEEKSGPFRLNGVRNVYASPLGAAGRIYVTDRDGTTLVLSHGANPQLLSANRLQDSFSASAAAVGNELYLRGEKFLYCISED